MSGQQCSSRDICSSAAHSSLPCLCSASTMPRIRRSASLIRPAAGRRATAARRVVPYPPRLAQAIPARVMQPSIYDEEATIAEHRFGAHLKKRMKACLRKEGVLHARSRLLAKSTWDYRLRFEVCIALTKTMGRGWILMLIKGQYGPHIGPPLAQED